MELVIKSSRPGQINVDQVDDKDLHINSVSSKSNYINLGTPNQRSEPMSQSRKSGYESSSFNFASDKEDQYLEYCLKPIAQLN